MVHAFLHSQLSMGQIRAIILIIYRHYKELYETFLPSHLDFDNTRENCNWIDQLVYSYNIFAPLTSPYLTFQGYLARLLR